MRARGGMGGMMPRFRGGGRGFMGPGQSPPRSMHQGHGPPPMMHDPRPRHPMRFRPHWVDEMPGINEPETFAETRMPDGRCYYYNTRTMETMWERPEGPGVRIIRHEDNARNQRNNENPRGARDGPQGSQQHPMNNLGQFGAPNFGMMPPWGFPQQGLIPPTGVPPPVNDGVLPGVGVGMSQSMADSGGVQPTGVPPPVPVDPLLAHVDVQIQALAAEWSEHISPDGRHYYYSSKTQNSTWEKPKALLDLDAAKLQAQHRIIAAHAQHQQPPPSVNIEPVSTIRTEQENIADKTKVKRPDKKVEKCRPISSTPVNGTAWCVVWTGDRRVFFYNPATKTSVWERPPDLVGRVDVDEIVRACPVDKDKDKEKEKKEKPATTIVTKLEEATSTTSPTMSDGSDKKVKSETATGVQPKEDLHPPGEEPSEPPQKRVRTSSENAVEDKGKASTDESEGKDSIETKDAIKEQSALEAEAKASRERATIPMEVRLKQFREMLYEKNVSAFSTWEKELHKIVFDQRYLLLNSGERKKAYDRYVEEVVEEERLEKQNRFKELKEKFFQFLADVNISSRMNYNDFSMKYGRDERYRCVEKSRDRENFFLEYMKMVQKKQKEERTQRKEREREEFLELLKEKVKDYHLTLPELRKKLEHDPRFQVVEPDERDELFRGFQRRLRHQQRSLKKEKKRERALNKSKSKSDNGETATVVVSDEVECEEGQKKEKADGPEDISEEEEGCITDDSDDDEGKADREKQERAEQSIREREKEVQRSLASHLRDRDKEREIHRHEEGVQEFQALLTDLIKTVDLNWKEAKKLIKKDRRWSFVSFLSREEMEDIYASHVDDITRRKKQRFKELLMEHRVNSKTRWRDLYREIKNDPRYKKFNASERKCQREFEDYIRDMNAHMKVDFRELLKETKMLNYKTYETLKQNPSFMKEIESHLENDRRYLELSEAPYERERLIWEYVDDLRTRGPPPPPTTCLQQPIRRK